MSDNPGKRLAPASRTNVFNKTLPLAAALLLIAFTAAAQAVPITSGLVQHLDASQINAADANQVTAGVVRQWNDLSPLANHASQVVSTRRPTYIADGGAAFNHRPVVRFDGSVTFLDASSNASFSLLGHDFAGLSSKSQATVFAVVKTNLPNDNRVAVDGTNAGATAHFPRVQTFTGKWIGGTNNSAFGTGTSSVTTDPTLYLSTFDGTQAIATDRLGLNINGIDETLTFSGSPLMDTGSVTRMLTGIWVSGGFVWNGDIAEVLIYDRLLSDAELNAVGLYLEEKYGLDTAFVPEPHTWTVWSLVGIVGMACAYCQRRTRKARCMSS
jgi:hypothetical protein